MTILATTSLKEVDLWQVYLASWEGTFQLAQGTQLKILVGQEGDRGMNLNSPDRPGGGGGGSFVTLTNNTPLIIAGGGGGGGTSRDNFKDGDPGQATENRMVPDAVGREGLVESPVTQTRETLMLIWWREVGRG